VTLAILVFNRRDELRTTLQKMFVECDYDGALDAIVVDNASRDGSADMVRDEFAQVQLIERGENIGASAWNDAFAVAQGDWVLVLDDDCYLPPDGLERAVAAAQEHEADMVSFKVVSTFDPEFVFSDKYRTGLFSFWGCAWLIRTQALRELGGYDREIFIWANELEFTMRFLDRGYRHLHLPEVVAQHMKAPPEDDAPWIEERGYRINARHWGYIAGKLLHRRDAVEALVALMARHVREGIRIDRTAFKGVAENMRGFVHGLRHREPLRRPEVSRFYRRNFETFASPWWLSRRPRELLRALPREPLQQRDRPEGEGRRAAFYAERARWYPQDEPATLQF
jgi:GT2 family glycosyltransferase